MPKYFSKNVTWPKLLRFPVLFGCLLIGTAYECLTYKNFFRKKIEKGREKHLRVADEMLERSKDNTAIDIKNEENKD